MKQSDNHIKTDDCDLVNETNKSWWCRYHKQPHFKSDNHVDGILIEHLQCGCHEVCTEHRNQSGQKQGDRLVCFVLGIIIGAILWQIIM